MHLAALGPSLKCDSNVFLRSINDALAHAQRDELLSLLHCFRDPFDTQRVELGRASSVSRHIDTICHARLTQPPYRVSSTERQVIHEHLADMINRGVVPLGQAPGPVS